MKGEAAGSSKVESQTGEKESPPLETNEDPAKSAEATEDTPDNPSRRSKRIAAQPKKEKDSKGPKIKLKDPIYSKLRESKKNSKKNARLTKARSDDEHNQWRSS